MPGANLRAQDPWQQRRDAGRQALSRVCTGQDTPARGGPASSRHQQRCSDNSPRTQLGPVSPTDPILLSQTCTGPCLFRLTWPQVLVPKRSTPNPPKQWVACDGAEGGQERTGETDRLTAGAPGSLTLTRTELSWVVTQTDKWKSQAGPGQLMGVAPGSQTQSREDSGAHGGETERQREVPLEGHMSGQVADRRSTEQLS